MRKKPKKIAEKQGKTSVLSPKRQAFVREYAKDHNATQAAIRAGYSKRTAREQAARLLSNVNISSAISEFMDKATKRTLITVDRVLDEYGKIAFTDLPGIVNFNRGMMSVEDFANLDDRQKACIKKFKIKTMTKIVNEEPVEVDTVELELHDKLHALDKLGMYLQMFVERKDVTLHNGEKEEEIRAMFDSMTYEEKLKWLEENQ